MRGPAAHGPERLLRAQAGVSDQRHCRDGHDPRHRSAVNMRVLEVFDEARDPGRKVRQPAEEADHDSRARRDTQSPPMPTEPPRIRNYVPVVPKAVNPMNRRAAHAPKTPSPSAYTISTQKCAV